MDSSRTDDRLDSLNRRADETNGKVDDLNREMHAEFRAVRGEMNGRFDSLENRIAAMTRVMMATVIGGLFTLLATVLATQL
jgi:hypothetical protein